MTCRPRRRQHIPALLFCFSLILPVQAIAEQSLAGRQLSAAEAGQRMALIQKDRVSGKFTQHKHFKVLAKPFVSSGSFTLAEDELLWQTQKPVSSRITLQDGSLILEDSTGVKQPGDQAAQFVQLLHRAMRGDLAALDAHFQFSSEPRADCVKMTPTEDGIRKVFREITLCGKGDVSEVKLVDGSDNFTEIELIPNPPQ